MRNLIKEEREHLLKLGYKLGKYEDIVSEMFRSRNYIKSVGIEEYMHWVDEYVMEDRNVIYKDMHDGNYMMYSIKYLRDKGVI